MKNRAGHPVVIQAETHPSQSPLWGGYCQGCGWSCGWYAGTRCDWPTVVRLARSHAFECTEPEGVLW